VSVTSFQCPWCKKVVRIPFIASSYRTQWNDIHDAAKEGTVDDVRYFIKQRGSDVNAKHKNGITPLHLAAAFNDNLEVLDDLILKGALINATNVTGSTPLHYAANWTANAEVIRHLIRAGALVNAQKYPPSDQTPLDMVEYNTHDDNWKIRNTLMEFGGVSGNEL